MKKGEGQEKCLKIFLDFETTTYFFKYDLETVVKNESYKII